MENYPMLFPFPSDSSSFWMSRSGFGMEGRNTKDGFQMGLRGAGTGTDDHRQKTSQQRDEGASVSARSEKKGGSGKKKGEKKVRRPRYAFQTRSQVDILDDGYRWRKYGQKSVKNNKFPRSYYRCTHQGCNVKKQVQRLTKDESMVVTTYEGVHTHSIEKTVDNFEHILSQMQIYTPI